MSEIQRRAFRTVFTKELKSVEELINEGAKSEDILAKFDTLTSTFEKLRNLDEVLLEKLIGEENVEESNIEKEVCRSNEYSTKYNKISRLIQKFQSLDQSDNISLSKTFSNKLRLPKIELKKFDGHLKNWIGFWSQFTKIHEDVDLGDEDKFEYLLQSMKPDSPPHKLIDGFPPSKENYQKAVELLKGRFGKDELLIEYYVRELLTLVLNRNSVDSVTQLYDRLEVQLRALESLGVTKEKYAAMLFPLVETAIPENVFKIWERYRVSKQTSMKEQDTCLKELLQFLKTEVEAEERLRLRENSFGMKSSDKVNFKKDIRVQRFAKPNLPSAAVLVSSEDSKPDKDLSFSRAACIFCEKTSHASADCFSIFEKTVTERSELVKKKGACLKCLRKGHLAHKCKMQVKCHFCMGKHLAILCQKVSLTKGRPNESISEDRLPNNEKNREPIPSTTNSFSTPDNKSKTTYLQTLMAFVDYNGKHNKVRVLCDSGSQKSFISNQCVQKLGLKCDGEVLIQQEVFGGKKTGPKRHKTYNICLNSQNFDFKTNIHVIEQHVICNQIPKMCDEALMKKLEQNNIILSDVSVSDEEVTSIDVLIGADAWTNIITPEFYKVDDHIVAIKTQLGWTVVGSTCRDSSFVSTMFIHLQSSQDIRQFWDLETMGITDPSVKLRKEEKDDQVIEQFEKTVTRDSTGRFIVQLPWVEGHPILEANRNVAEKRLLTTTRKLKNMNLYSEYDSVFEDWLNKGVIERVETPDMLSDATETHYLPLRAVVKEGSTTRIRPVFDASCKDRNGFCLNDCLEVGPNLIELVPRILTNLRKHTFALSSDIEKAFLQISIKSDDRDMLRFLWWNNGEIITYRHTRVVFGLSCSPFLLGAVLNNLLRNAPNTLKPIAEALQKSFYVDNCLTGVDNIEDQDTLIHQAQELLELGKFNLRDWIGNGHFGHVNTHKPIQNVLGLKWNCFDDTLSCASTLLHMNPDELTRRTLLSCAQRIYDPLGFTAPVTLIPKVILQKTWNLKIGWDEKLPEDLQAEYYKWSKQINCIEECKIRRRIIVNSNSTLHVFCDASKMAFGACIFLRTEINDNVHVSLILAKSRVSPTKQITLPRLELVGALTGVRLCTLALKCLDSPDIPVYYWSDSSVTLSWISKQGKWSVFVENRVKEINKFSNPSQWRYIPGQANPADVVSRGCSPQQLLKSQWWNGPKWLYDPKNEWPTENPIPDQNLIDMEKKKTMTIMNSVEYSSIAEVLGKRFSKYSSIVRTIAWMLRLTAERETKSVSDITSEEFTKAEKVLFKIVQNDSFGGEQTKKYLSGIRTYTDEEGLIRLKSRLLNQDYSQEYTNPIVLPSNHIVVERLIKQQHIDNKHAGVQTLLVTLRERVWILKGRKTIGRVVHKCIPCKKISSKPFQASEAPLPKERTTVTSCFQITGIDLAGPLITRKNKKYWVVIFTCAVFRAVHLEFVPSLSTAAFILALRRFIARRGRINVIYTDNGTNFVGLYNLLKSLDWTKIQKEFNLKNLVWKFNPPAAPWWGGFWERLVRILKELLRRNLGNASLDYEELNTLVCECEGVMNGRPLTYVSEDSEDLKPLTPSMFIQSLQGNDVSDLDLLEKTSLISRWRYILKIRNGLKSRFEKEYLGSLKCSKKNMSKEKEVCVGDIVLIHTEGKRKVTWPLGKVIELFPGKDNITRLVKIKVKNGTLLRPIQKIYPLEIKSKDELNFEPHKDHSSKTSKNVLANKINDNSANEDLGKIQITCKSGRQIKKPKRLDL